MDDSSNMYDRKGLWASIKEGYELLVLTVIRPMRAEYDLKELGPPRMLINDILTTRDDLQLTNPAGLKLECSWWRPKTPMIKSCPCIIVLHGNSSCRLGAIEIVRFAIPAGFSVFALDFSGSGRSEGKYVSLGYHEQEDIATVVDFLQDKEEVSSICLWGRSMGAVACLLYAEREINDGLSKKTETEKKSEKHKSPRTIPQNKPKKKMKITAMVLDSPFSSLPRLATELVTDGKLNVPGFAVKLIMRLIRRDIRSRAKFDMFKLQPIDKISKCTIPAFFLIGENDELVGPHHVDILAKAHNGPNQVFRFNGGHNSARPMQFFIDALQFFRVMGGQMPVPPETFQSIDRQLSRQGTSRTSSKSTRPTKEFINPLPEGMMIDQVPQMSVKELKTAIHKVGYSDTSCIEKKDLVNLVVKLYARHVRSLPPEKQIKIQLSRRASTAGSIHEPPLNLAKQSNTQQIQRRNSVDEAPPSKIRKGQSEYISRKPEVTKDDENVFESDGLSRLSESVISDDELSSKFNCGSNASDVEEFKPHN